MSKGNLAVGSDFIVSITGFTAVTAAPSISIPVISVIYTLNSGLYCLSTTDSTAPIIPAPTNAIMFIFPSF